MDAESQRTALADRFRWRQVYGSQAVRPRVFCRLCTVWPGRTDGDARLPPRAERKTRCISLQSVSSLGWASIASLATAFGTLVLAVATFAAVRSANRAARAAEQSLLVGLRPLLVPSRLQDETQKVLFGDGRWIPVPGGRATLEAEDDVIYLTMSLRNAGRGIAVVHGWRFYGDWDADRPEPALDEFHRQNRDLYLPPGEVGFWQAAFRDQHDPQYEEACKAVTAREQMTIDVLYGDHEGGQRVITRFSIMPRGEDIWLLSAGRHWNVDRPDPR